MHIRKHAQTQGTAMAKLTKTQTVASVRNVLYSYKKKIESVMYDTDKLLPEAQAIVDDYRSDNGIIQNLMKKALDENSSFFEDMDTSLLLQYAQTCYELNTLFDLKVSNLPKITAITEEEKNYSINFLNSAGSFKVPSSYWNSFSSSVMKKFNAVGNKTKCNQFIPFFLKGFGDKVYKDIIPTETSELSAYKLYEAWERNPTLHNLNNLCAETFKNNSEINIQNAAAYLANYYANQGYLVLAAASNGGNHVAIVAPQSTIYKCTPELPSNSVGFINSNGNISHQGSIEPLPTRDYPVFLQAGTYTGTVPPGWAFNRTMFNNGQVQFYVYKPL